MTFVSTCGPWGCLLWSPSGQLILCHQSPLHLEAPKLVTSKAYWRLGSELTVQVLRVPVIWPQTFSLIYPFFPCQYLTSFCFSVFQGSFSPHIPEGSYWPMKGVNTQDLGAANGVRTEAVPGSPVRKGEWTCRQALQEGSQILNPSQDEVWEVSFELCPDRWRALPAGRLRGARRERGHSR